MENIELTEPFSKLDELILGERLVTKENHFSLKEGLTNTFDQRFTQWLAEINPWMTVPSVNPICSNETLHSVQLRLRRPTLAAHPWPATRDKHRKAAGYARENGRSAFALPPILTCVCLYLFLAVAPSAIPLFV